MSTLGNSVKLYIVSATLAVIEDKATTVVDLPEKLSTKELELITAAIEKNPAIVTLKIINSKLFEQSSTRAVLIDLISKAKFKTLIIRFASLTRKIAEEILAAAADSSISCIDLSNNVIQLDEKCGEIWKKLGKTITGERNQLTKLILDNNLRVSCATDRPSFLFEILENFISPESALTDLSLSKLSAEKPSEVIVNILTFFTLRTIQNRLSIYVKKPILRLADGFYDPTFLMDSYFLYGCRFGIRLKTPSGTVVDRIYQRACSLNYQPNMTAIALEFANLVVRAQDKFEQFRQDLSELLRAKVDTTGQLALKYRNDRIDTMMPRLLEEPKVNSEFNKWLTDLNNVPVINSLDSFVTFELYWRKIAVDLYSGSYDPWLELLFKDPFHQLVGFAADIRPIIEWLALVTKRTIEEVWKDPTAFGTVQVFSVVSSKTSAAKSNSYSSVATPKDWGTFNGSSNFDSLVPAGSINSSAKTRLLVSSSSTAGTTRKATESKETKLADYPEKNIFLPSFLIRHLINLRTNPTVTELEEKNKSVFVPLFNALDHAKTLEEAYLALEKIHPQLVKAKDNSGYKEVVETWLYSYSEALRLGIPSPNGTPVDKVILDNAIRVTPLEKKVDENQTNNAGSDKGDTKAVNNTPTNSAL